MRSLKKRRYLGLVFGLYGLTGQAYAELLGRISDDTAPRLNASEAKSSKSDERQIVYRVICAPEDQDLPDCDRAGADGDHSPDGLPLLPMPDLPPDAEDLADQAEQSRVVADAAGDVQPKPASKHHTKKSATTKKSAKKTNRAHH